MAMWREARFTLADDEDGEFVFEGWTDGKTWNGWSIPAATPASVRSFFHRYNEWHRRNGNFAQYGVTVKRDGDGNWYLVGEDEDYLPVVPLDVIKLDGVRLLSLDIGWTFIELE